MFAKLCNWVVMGSLACLLGACGGGDPEGFTGTSAAALSVAASPSATGVAYGSAAGAAPGSAEAMAYQEGGGSSAMQVQDSRAFGASVRASAIGGVQYSAGMAQIDDIAETIRTQRDAIPRVLRTRATDPEVADDDERDGMALREAEFERSFSLEKNRELAERRALEGIAEPVGQQPYVPHEDCVDPRLPECAAHGRLARY